MSPAPANESSAMFLSPFFTSSTTAAPLSERDCNGVFACPAVSKVPAAACAMRRGASFLDAEDACLALSDKTSFLIPEDSYLPGQENFFAPPCAPAALPAVGRAPCCPSSGVHIATAAAMATARSHLPMPFPLLDTPVFGGEDEFAAASICFEKAVLALEMVERPGGVRDPNGACLQAPSKPQECAPTVSDASSSGGHSRTDFDVQQQHHHHHHQQEVSIVRQTPARRLSLLTPSLPARGLMEGGVPDQFFPALPCDHVTVAGDAATVTVVLSCSDQDSTDAVESAILGIWRPAVQEPIAGETVDLVGADVPAVGMGSAGGLMLAGKDAQAAATLSDGALPAAPAPVPRAFHHKTGGPCDHCGATESPQWRRGPPAKPMLCNACGTRFRRTNQLNPVAALSPAGRAAAAAAAAAAAPAAKRNSASKRDPPYVASTSSKRGRASTF